jgi:copper resistance protein B
VLASPLAPGGPDALRAQEMDNLVFHWSQLEVDAARFDETAFGRWEGSGWIGTDFDRLWWSTEGEATDAGVGGAEAMALYGHYVRRFWDVVVGYRHDFEPVQQGYLTLGVMGLAPYWFEVGAFAFVSHRGEPSLRFEAETDLLLTQRLILSVGGEMDWLVTDDDRLGMDAGVSDVELGLRTRYEIRRKFAPYVDLTWVREKEALLGAVSPLTESGFRIGAGLRLIY